MITWIDWTFLEIPGRKAIERMLGPSGIFGILVVVDVGRGGRAVLSDYHQINIRLIILVDGVESLLDEGILGG